MQRPTAKQQVEFWNPVEEMEEEEEEEWREGGGRRGEREEGEGRRKECRNQRGQGHHRKAHTMDSGFSKTNF